MKKGIELSLQENDFKEKISAVILCAGEGKRLKQITKTIPKPLLKIKKLNNTQILEHIINNLINIEINQIGIVVGYLGDSVRKFILTLEKNNQSIKDKLIIIDSEKDYRLGPLFSFLSIIKNKDFFTPKNHYLVIPGDTIFDYHIFKEVLFIISRNFESIKKHPFVFYRTMGLKPLKELYNIDKIISSAEIDKLDSEIILKEITQMKINDIPPKNLINQLIPITVISYNSINKILNLKRKNLNKTIWETLNYIIFNGSKVLAFEIEEKYFFYDIDYLNDMKI
jgi:NDP-sugar pyrophosphorylase family protein